VEKERRFDDECVVTSLAHEFARMPLCHDDPRFTCVFVKCKRIFRGLPSCCTDNCYECDDCEQSVTTNSGIYSDSESIYDQIGDERHSAVAIEKALSRDLLEFACVASPPWCWIRINCETYKLISE